MKKNLSSFKKPRRSKTSKKRLLRKQQKTQSSSQFDYQSLEPRYALDASFTLDDDGNIDLFAFTGDVVITNLGPTFTANVPGAFTFLDNGEPIAPEDIPDNVFLNGGSLTIEGGISSVDVDLQGSGLTFGESIFEENQPVNITNAGSVSQNGLVIIEELTVSGFGDFNLSNEENMLNMVEADVDGGVFIVSAQSVTGDTIIGDGSVSITTTGIVNFNQIDSNGTIQVAAGGGATVGIVGNGITQAVDIDAASINATSITTQFTSVAGDVNNIGADPVTNVRLRATGGQTVIGILDPNGYVISDTPITRDNGSGGITIAESIVSDEVLLQASDGIDIPIDGLDTLYLFLGGQLESESRGVFQLDVPSLQELSVNLFDGFAISSEQDLTVGNFEFTGVNPLQFTDAFSDLYANITATSLTFAAPFEAQKLVADVTIDITQNPGAVLTVDDLYVSGEEVVLDNVNNDFQRIAAVGQGFLADDRTNNEDILTIRDQGTLEIAVLDNLPDDTLVIDLATPIVPNTLAGISLAGQVDILTGFGGPIPVQPEGAVEPSFEQLGNTIANVSPINNIDEFEIERFEIPRDRAGTQTGIFRDDNYNGALRPVYFIEFFYDGTQDLVIQTDEFERGNPEPVRNFIDIELALYNEFGELVALGEELARELDEIAFSAGTLAPGRYFVAASAFSTEFEDDFVVRTANTQTGTLNVTITGNVADTPVLSRDLTQAVGAPLIVLGGDEPIPEDAIAELDPADFPTEDLLVQLDPNAAGFVPEPVEFDPIGDPLPEVDGRATLGAANGGTIRLGLNTTNDIRELVVSEAGGVEFADTNNLLVSNLDAPGQSRLAAGLDGEGGELVVGDVSSSTLLLQAASGVRQEGIITTEQLLLGGNDAIQGGGDFVILSDTLENVAFNLPAGNLAITTSQALNIDFVQFNDPDDPLEPSFIFDESFVSGTARIEAASININTQVLAETLVLDVQDSIVQAPATVAAPNTDPDLIPSAPSIIANSLSISATTVELNQPQNSVIRVAGDVSGSLGLVNENPITFATINNTVETTTRLRPTNVTQTFNPLETINGLTVAGTADIITGLDGALVPFPVTGGFTQEPGTVVNIGTANLTALNGGGIDLVAPQNDINFGNTNGGDISLELEDGATVAGIVASGNLFIQGLGQLTVESAATVDGSITIDTVGDVVLGEIIANAANPINGSIIVNSGGNITDTTGALSATGTITLNAVDEIDGVDFVDGSIVVATSNTDDISLVGLGELTVLDVTAPEGEIDIITADDVIVGSVNSTSTVNIETPSDLLISSPDDLNLGEVTALSATLSAENDIFIGSLTTVNETSITAGMIVNVGDITSTSVVINAGILNASNLTATTGDVELTSTDGLLTEDVTADNGNITINSVETLVTGALAANNINVTTGNSASIASVTAVAAATLNSQDVLNVATVVAETASLTAAENVTVQTVNTVGDAVLTAGDGNLTGDLVVSETGTVSLSSLQLVNVGEANAFGDVTLEAGNAVNTELVVSETGSATINSNGNLSALVVEAAVDAILIAPRSDVFSESVIAGESAQLTSGAFLFTRNVEAPDVVLDAGTNQVAQRVIADTATISSQIDLGLNDIQVGDLTISAGDDIFDAGFLDGNRVTTDNLVIIAGNSNDETTFGGVVLETDVDTLTVITEGDSFGNIVIRELDDLVLGDIEAGNGGINISAGGTISGGSLRTVNQNDSNDVRLIATGDASDIRVDSIDVGNVGDAFLIADDDVVITGGGNQVTADFIFVSAKNRSVGDIDGIALSTNVGTADLIVGDVNDAEQSRGDITISDTNALNINFARTLNGTIDATANGNLVVSNIQSTGVNVPDAITLTATGTGADVVTSRVAVLQQAGGVVLTADDDVRDANPQDSLLVIADNLTIDAGNNLDDLFNGINVQSRVNSINATADSTPIPDGDLEGLREATIAITNTGQLTVNQASTDSGLIRVVNINGFLTINDLNLSSSSSDNRVFIQTTGNASDIAVGSINAGSRGTVIIDSADDIFDTDFLDDLFVEGEFLSAISNNLTDDAFDGIILNVVVENFVSDARLDGVVSIAERG